MTILRIGSTKQFADNWDTAFGKKKSKGSAAATKKKTKKAAKKSKKR